MTRKWSLILTLMVGLVFFGAIGCSEDDDNGSSDMVLDTPTGLTLTQNGDDVAVTWNAVTNATGYRLQIASNDAFDTDLMDMNVTSTSYDWTNAGANPGTYYVRVSANGDVDYDNSSFATAASIDVVADAPVILTGVITDDMTLTADHIYLLRGGVFVGNEDDPNHSTTLTIEPGTIIYGESATEAMLVITRGGKIMAEGTVDAPIVFTSDQPVGSRAREDWGGVIINGWAVLNTGDEAEGEGGTGPYGGTNDADNSGTMRYCRIEFAGSEISPDNELNGLALQGVGSGTTLEYIQVHMNKDDGIEFFGGTVNAKHIFITGAADDQFDWTDGWRGKGQFWCAQQYEDDADQGIEADNSGEENDATPRSFPTLYNLTLVGAMNNDNGESDVGMLIREGTAINLYNAIVANFGEAGLDIDQEATFVNAVNNPDDFIMDYVIFAGNHEDLKDDGDDDYFSVAEFMTTTMLHNQFIADYTTVLTDPTNTTSPNFTPIGVAAGTAKNAPADGFFTDAPYYGAFDPNGTSWLTGWTTSARN